MEDHLWVAGEGTGIPSHQWPAQGRLVSTSIPAPGLEVEYFLRHSQGKERFFWQNGPDDVLFAGFGIAVEMMAWGQTRFNEIEQKANSLFSKAVIESRPNILAYPRMFGGFSFSDDFTADNTWAVFHPAHFIIPHFQYVHSDGESWLTINAVISEDDSLEQLINQLTLALNARYEYLVQFQKKSIENHYPPPNFKVNFPMAYETWAENINKAVELIHKTELRKVVLSRACELRSKEKIDIESAVNYLNKQFDGCIRFLFEPRPNHAFYGATPELLVKVNNREMRTMALAGSMRRGANPAEDAKLAKELFNSGKDRQEHKLVVESLIRRLQPLTDRLFVEEVPQIYTLSYIHHLQTPINGELKTPMGVLPLVEVLHPTPALGGTPRELALDFIRRAEPIPRGWYAAPIGLIDPNLDGEFAVAIRSAIAQERRVWLYAGAGIVAHSIPEKEWAETNLKFRPMFAALNQDFIHLDHQMESHH